MTDQFTKTDAEIDKSYDEPRPKRLADAIEEALLDWATQTSPCIIPPGCGREDCSLHQMRNKTTRGACRARSEYIAAKISGAAILYAGHGRDPQDRINELLRSNNELLERARKAEAEVALVRAELAKMGEKVASAFAKEPIND